MNPLLLRQQQQPFLDRLAVGDNGLVEAL